VGVNEWKVELVGKHNKEQQGQQEQREREKEKEGHVSWRRDLRWGEQF